MRRITIFALICLPILLSCSGPRGREQYTDTLLQMEGSAEVSAQRIEEIKGEIRRYQKEVRRRVDATGQIGVYYKMLAVEYMKAKMFQAAYDALKEAIAIHPENPILSYYSAVCAARMSKAQVEQAQRDQWLKRAESLYRRALDLDPRYADALYGLAILYIYELDRAAQAQVLLEDLLEVEKGAIEARFLLAGVYYANGQLEKALQLYRDIAAATEVEEKRREALANQKRIEEELYGSR